MKWDVRHGKLERSTKGGIDWYRYETTFLIPKLFPFDLEGMQSRPAAVVQEYGTLSHPHHYSDIISLRLNAFFGVET